MNEALLQLRGLINRVRDPMLANMFDQWLKDHVQTFYITEFVSYEELRYAGDERFLQHKKQALAHRLGQGILPAITEDQKETLHGKRISYHAFMIVDKIPEEAKNEQR